MMSIFSYSYDELDEKEKQQQNVCKPSFSASGVEAFSTDDKPIVLETTLLNSSTGVRYDGSSTDAIDAHSDLTMEPSHSLLW
jgi:hypothetical protein